MRIGLDTFSLRDLKLNPFQQLDATRERGFAGVQFGGLRSLSRTLDPGELRAVRAQADGLGLYSHVSLSLTCNPHLAKRDPADHTALIRDEIERAAACGWRELHASLGGGDERYTHPVPWPRHLADAAAFLRTLAPVLRHHGSRINLETHGDSTTFELIRLIEEVGPDCVGICLDTANLLCHAEEPLAAVTRAAPYTHLTHIKDGWCFFTDRGYVRQTVPPGQGLLDWDRILPVLAAASPDLPLSVEDHKWLFQFPCFEPDWLARHPDLTREELAAFLQLVWRGQKRLAAGDLPDPEASERIPHAQERDARLAAARAVLTDCLTRLGLDGRPPAPN